MDHILSALVGLLWGFIIFYSPSVIKSHEPIKPLLQIKSDGNKTDTTFIYFK